MPVLQTEQLPAVLEHEAQPVGNQPRPHAAEVRLNHRHHHPVLVGAAEIGGIAVARCLSRMRSEEHTSELQSLMRISYAVFCLKKTKQPTLLIHVTYYSIIYTANTDERHYN